MPKNLDQISSGASKKENLNYTAARSAPRQKWQLGNVGGPDDYDVTQGGRVVGRNAGSSARRNP